MRILFVQPPTPFWVGGDELAGDRRVIGLVPGTALIFVIVLFLSLLSGWLRIDWLQSPLDYLIVTVSVIIWMFSLRAVWRTKLLNRYVETTSARFRDK